MQPRSTVALKNLKTLFSDMHFVGKDYLIMACVTWSWFSMTMIPQEKIRFIFKGARGNIP